jgi:outer membrane protein assembly factor BamE (lipoprotein component of BamABCDE complex)
MRSLVVFGLISFSVYMFGCSSSKPPEDSVPEITQEKFDQLSVGMTPKQVEEIMGDTPHLSAGVPEEWTYAKEGKRITVKFDDGKLSEKSSHGLP